MELPSKHERTFKIYNAVINSHIEMPINLPEYCKFKRVDFNGSRCPCKICKELYNKIKEFYTGQ